MIPLRRVTAPREGHDEGMQRLVRAASIVASAAVALLLAGCGGGSKATTTSTAQATTTMSPAAQRAEIRRVWTQFFSGKTSASTKISLLQHGDVFAPAIKAQASSALAKQASAKVTSVKLLGPAKASVAYTVELAGAPVLAHQKGTAVKESGSWKVGVASFCKLLALQGAPPKACPKSG